MTAKYNRAIFHNSPATGTISANASDLDLPAGSPPPTQVILVNLNTGAELTYSFKHTMKRESEITGWEYSPPIPMAIKKLIIWND